MHFCAPDITGYYIVFVNALNYRPADMEVLPEEEQPQHIDTVPPEPEPFNEQSELGFYITIIYH